MIVIDTSVAIKWAFGERGHAEALALLDLDEPRYAPDLLVPELCHVLRRKTLRGEATREQARAALEKVTAEIELFIPSTNVASSAFALSEALNHSAYDCFFLAVALGNGVAVTADMVFAKKCADLGYGAFAYSLDDPFTVLLAKTSTLKLPSELTIEDLKRSAAFAQATLTLVYGQVRKANPENRFVSTSLLNPAFDSPAYLALRKRLAGLTDEQLSALLATAWLGREYHSASDWPQLIANAKRTVAEGFDTHSAYIAAQMHDLFAGLEKLRSIGLT